jgi:hypothetical protein
MPRSIRRTVTGSGRSSWPAHEPAPFPLDEPELAVTQPSEPHGDALDWLRAANQDWKRRAEIATGRAESAERFLHAETAERKRLATSRILWRRLAISGYTYFGGYSGIVEWHWSRYVYLACGFVATVAWLAVEEIEARRAKRKAVGR